MESVRFGHFVQMIQASIQLLFLKVIYILIWYVCLFDESVNMWMNSVTSEITASAKYILIRDIICSLVFWVAKYISKPTLARFLVVTNLITPKRVINKIASN